MDYYYFLFDEPNDFLKVLVKFIDGVLVNMKVFTKILWIFSSRIYISNALCQFKIMIPILIFINIKKIGLMSASKSVRHHRTAMYFVYVHWILIRVNIV